MHKITAQLILSLALWLPYIVQYIFFTSVQCKITRGWSSADFQLCIVHATWLPLQILSSVCGVVHILVGYQLPISACAHAGTGQTIGLKREATSEQGSSRRQLSTSSKMQNIRMWPKSSDVVGDGLVEPMQGVSQAVHPTSSCHLGSRLPPSPTGGCSKIVDMIIINFHSLSMLVLRWLQYKWKLGRLEKLFLKLLPAFDQKGWDAEMLSW